VAAAAPTGAAPWQRVEAVRHALFTLSDRSFTEVDTYYGRGVLKAAAALDKPFRTDLAMTPPDEVSFPWLRAVDMFESLPDGVERMYEVEALQVFLQSPQSQELAGGADPVTDRLSPTERKRILHELARSPLASNALRNYIIKLL
jgi:hypothetical protein